MKRFLCPALPLLAAVALPAVSLAQDAPAPGTPAAGTPPAGAAPAATEPATAKTPSTPAAKPKPLSAGDKSFVNKALNSLFFVISLTEKKKQESIALASTKKAVQKINTDTNKIWGELAKIASDTNEKIPAEVTGSDKSKLSRVSKAEGNKFDKELLKALTKETGDLEKWFESASKSSQSPEVKTVVQNWLPTVRGMATEASKAEKEAAKAK